MSDANQILMHQLQVNKYPNCVDGGYLDQIFSRSGSKIWSVVNKRESLNVAKDRIRRLMSVSSGIVPTSLSISFSVGSSF